MVKTVLKVWKEVGIMNKRVRDCEDLFGWEDGPKDLIMSYLQDYYPRLSEACGGLEAPWENVGFAIADALRSHFYNHYILYDYDGVYPPIDSELEVTAAERLYAESQRINRLIRSTLLDYNPIENYRMTETESTSGSRDTEEATSQSGSGSGSATSREYPYNTDVSTPVGTSESETESSVSGSRTEGVEHSDTRELTRSGNIGVTTSQQMLISEREISISALKWIFEVLNPFFLLDVEVRA